VTIAARAAKLTVVVRGAAAPRGWSAGAQACATKAHGHRGTVARLAVSCVLPGGGATPGGGAPAGSGTTPASTPAPAPTATPTPAPVTPTPTATPAAAAPYTFAPYADLSAWPPPDLAAMSAGTGAKDISLGFVVQSTAGGCTPTWGGFPTYPASGATPYQLAQTQALQQAGGDVIASFGGDAGTAGLSDWGTGAISDAIANGVTLSLVNVMTMDFGVAATNGQMGQYATQAGEHVLTQLAALHPSASSGQIARMLGLTPMIGINDQSYEIFDTQDATAVETWAANHHIGMLGMWSLGHDDDCGIVVTTKQDHCSGVTQAKWQFGTTLGAFTG
jgi:hypothetical protein